jgi:hypothetical protein
MVSSLPGGNVDGYEGDEYKRDAMEQYLLYETSLGTQNFLFVPRPCDIAHPSSGSAQSLPRACSGLLTFAHPNYHFQQAAPQHAELLQL